MENIWLYSLSTLAQVMSAIIALFGVFVVFQLSRIQDFMDGERKKFSDGISKGIEDVRYTLGISDEEFLNKWANYLKNDAKGERQDNWHNSPYLAFEKLVSTKKFILGRLIISLVLCAISIIFSLILLASPFSINGFEYQDYNTYFLAPLIIFSCFTIGYVTLNIYSISKK